jgi:hypothetical protein
MHPQPSTTIKRKKKKKDSNGNPGRKVELLLPYAEAYEEL